MMLLSTIYQHFKISREYQNEMKIVENLTSCLNIKIKRKLLAQTGDFKYRVLVY